MNSVFGPFAPIHARGAQTPGADMTVFPTPGPEFHTVSAQRSLPDSRQNGGCIRIPAECVARC